MKAVNHRVRSAWAALAAALALGSAGGAAAATPADGCAGRVIGAVSGLHAPLYDLSTRQIAAVAANRDLVGRTLVRCDAATGLYVLMFAGRELGIGKDSVSLSQASDAGSADDVGAEERAAVEREAADRAKAEAQARAEEAQRLAAAKAEAERRAAAEAEARKVAEAARPRPEPPKTEAGRGEADAAFSKPRQDPPRETASAPPSAPEAPPPVAEPPPTPPPPAAAGGAGGVGTLGSVIAGGGASTGAVTRGGAPTGAARSISPGGRQRVTTAVFVDLTSLDLRRSRNGGSSVVLLSSSPRDFDRNLRLCRALTSQLQSASVGEVITGERDRGATTQVLRPLYWLLKSPIPRAATDACAERISRYDFERASNIRRKYGLTGRGPYVVIARQDETRAALVDFGAAPIEDTEDLVRYFKDAFSQDADIWAPERHAPGAGEQRIAAFLGRSIAGVAVTALVTPIAQAACPLGDPLDVCGQ